MAATNILTTGTTAATSSDATFTSDTVVGLKGTGDAARITVDLKDDQGAYHRIGTLTSSQPATVLAPGTYRFRRPAGPSCGVYSG